MDRPSRCRSRTGRRRSPAAFSGRPIRRRARPRCCLGRRAQWRSSLRSGGRCARGRASPRRLHLRRGRTRQRSRSDRARGCRRHRDIRAGRGRLRGHRGRGSQCRRWGHRGWKLLSDRRDGQGGGAARGAVPTQPGDHRLLLRGQAGLPERDVARAGRGTGGRQRDNHPGPRRGDPRPSRRARRHDRGHAGPLFAAAQLRVLDRGRLRAPDERLSIRSDAGPTPAPYVAGTLLAIRAVLGRTGLTRGLDTLLLG